MIPAVDFEKIIMQGIKDLPQQYLGEVADFVFFLREKKTKQQVKRSIIPEKKDAMLRLLHYAKNDAPIIDASIDIRALIDQTHDRKI
jgi:hypothetical protein